MPSFLHAALAAALALSVSFAHAACLNDTGIVVCGDASNNNVDCATTAPAGRPGGMR